MLDHASLVFWKKCPSCGYCELYTNNLSKLDKERCELYPTLERQPQEPVNWDQLYNDHSETSIVKL